MQNAAEQRKLAPRVPDFGLSSKQCQLVMAFEEADSLAALAELFERDVSVISRQMKKIAEIAPVLEKKQGLWTLTALGRQLNQWTREAINAQKRILMQQAQVRWGTTPEFAERVIAPELQTLLANGESKVSVESADEGTERLLLPGKVDLSIDFGRPSDPAIQVKPIAKIRVVIVATPAFLQLHQVKRSSDLQTVPSIQYVRASNPQLFRAPFENLSPVAVFSTLGATREACLRGSGWTVLPLFAVKKELASLQLAVVPNVDLPEVEVGIWWLKGRTAVASWVEHAANWLKSLSLS